MKDNEKNNDKFVVSLLLSTMAIGFFVMLLV